MRLTLACTLLLWAECAAKSDVFVTTTIPTTTTAESHATSSYLRDNVPQSQTRYGKELNFLSRTMKGDRLKGFLRSGDDHANEQQECDPSSSSPDLGILSCGYSRYCVESRRSALGGVCVSQDQAVDTRILQSATTSLGQNEPLSNTIQRRRGDNYLFESLSQACIDTNYCDCSEFDFEQFHGIVECTRVEGYCSRSENYCGEEVELCYTSDIILEANGHDDYSYTTCMTYTAPYPQRVCVSYSTADSDSCAVEFNNNMCQACTPELRTYKTVYEQNGQPYIYSYSQRCFQFDCTDNEGGHSGNTCERNVATIQHNVVFVREHSFGIHELMPSSKCLLLTSLSF
jgi:hypothetical protein